MNKETNQRFYFERSLRRLGYTANLLLAAIALAACARERPPRIAPSSAIYGFGIPVTPTPTEGSMHSDSIPVESTAVAADPLYGSVDVAPTASGETTEVARTTETPFISGMTLSLTGVDAIPVHSPTQYINANGFENIPQFGWTEAVHYGPKEAFTDPEKGYVIFITSLTLETPPGQETNDKIMLLFVQEQHQGPITYGHKEGLLLVHSTQIAGDSLYLPGEPARQLYLQNSSRISWGRFEPTKEMDISGRLSLTIPDHGTVFYKLKAWSLFDGTTASGNQIMGNLNNSSDDLFVKAP